MIGKHKTIVVVFLLALLLGFFIGFSVGVVVITTYIFTSVSTMFSASEVTIQFNETALLHGISEIGEQQIHPVYDDITGEVL